MSLLVKSIVEDKMFRNILIVLIGVLLTTTLVSAQTVIPGGYVSGSWEASGSPFLVEGEITVHSDSTLNIEPGVEVNFQGHYKLIINGLLEAIGTQSDSILFTAADTVEGWHGIRFIDAPDSSHISYCIVEYGRAAGDSLDQNGGGILCEGSNPVVSHCLIRDNSAEGYGGGIFCSDYGNPSNPIIDHCTFRGDSSSWGGGIFCIGMTYNSDPTIRYCDIIENIGCGITLLYTDAPISYCNISQNIGSGIYCFSDVASTIEYCTLSQNYGYNGGGIICDWYSDIHVNHCTIIENSASYNGGGICIVYGSWPSIVNCTISRNSAVQNGGGIGSHSANGAHLYMYNTIIEGSSGNGGVYLEGFDLATMTHCDFSNNEHGNFTGTSIPPGVGQIVTVNANGDSCDAFMNIFLDPEFVYPTQSDHRLQWGSPCIDAGHPDPQYNDPDGTISDMGAYFYDQSMPLRILLTPYNTPIEIPAAGGSFDYYIQATNIDPLALNINVWCDVTLPNGSVSGSVLGPVNLDIGSEITIGRERTQTVPPGAPAGMYSYNAYATAGADTSSDSFTFVKLGMDGLDGMAGWFNTGESFDELMPESDNVFVPEVYSLEQNYPNPFNPLTTINFNLPVASHVKLTVYDLQGRMVSALVNGNREPGKHTVSFDASHLASGMYICRIEAVDYISVRKMVLMK
jgi:parallel beta-helix repeat protein